MLSGLEINRAQQSRLPQVDFDALGFGNYFSDHMFSTMFRDGRWQQPEIMPYGPIPIEPAAASLHYGQSVFEGLKAFMGDDGRVRVFRPDMNAARLRASCERLCIPPIDDEVFHGAIHELILLDHRWIPRERGQSLYIRPIVFSSEGQLEVRPSTSYRFVVMTSPVGAYYEQTAGGVALRAEEKYTRAAPGGTGYAKTGGNYAASLYPGRESREAGFDQVLWLDGLEHRHVEEVGQMNIFFKIRDRVVTPELRGTILPGVTRDSVITLLKDRGIEVEERRIAIEELIEASWAGELEEAFGAGTAAVISPVGRIAYRQTVMEINDNTTGPLTAELYQAITGIQHGEVEDRHGWNVVIDVEQTEAAKAAAGI